MALSTLIHEHGTPVREEQEAPAIKGGTGPVSSPRSIGMALYGDLTFDSRVRKEARTLAGAGYSVTIVCLANHGPRSDLPSNVKVLVLRPPEKAITPGSTSPFVAAHRRRIARLLARGAWLVAYARGLREWGKLAVSAAGHVDVWHAHDLTGLAAVVPHLRQGTPVVYDSHELFLDHGTASQLPNPVRVMLRKFERRLVARAACVITVNDEIANIIRQRYGPAEIAVVHNCPDRWVAPIRRPSLIREAADIPAGVPIVLYHGGLTGGRGVERLMETLLLPGFEDIHLVLMGNGDKRDEFRSTAGSARWNGRIHVLDPVPPSALLSWVASADVGAMPNPGMTRNDILSSPNKLFECFAAGTPVVASNFPTIRRFIVDNPGGPLGAVCDPSRIESIGDAIRSVLSRDPAEMDALRARCLRAAAERWNWDQESETLLAVYSRILPERTG